MLFNAYFHDDIYSSSFLFQLTPRDAVLLIHLFTNLTEGPHLFKLIITQLKKSFW